MPGLIQQIQQKILRLASMSDSQSRPYDAEQFPALNFLDPESKSRLEHNLGVRIHNIPIFEQALVHRSYLQLAEDENVKSNERLEFFGDAILSSIVAEKLFYLHKDVSEGELTKMRSWLVNRKSLAYCARQLDLTSFLMVSLSARQSLEQGNESIPADALEAIIAAIYLDSGAETARSFVVSNILTRIMKETELMRDTNYKSIVLEHSQAAGKGVPRYSVVDESGPDHDRQFTVELTINSETVGRGIGRNKKEAEQNAASNAMRALKIKVKRD